ncbi:DUF3352 domain-containing protein [Desulfamplus magnetovallimortis]|nr:DUF3352 domain-containing protein [Desulfamplus magnetovallimortis]
MLKDYKSTAISVDLKSSDLKAHFYVQIIESSKLFSLFKGITVNRDIVLGIPDSPALLWSAAQNMQNYWKLLQDTLDKETLELIKEGFHSVKTEYGIDLETELINNLGSNFSAGIYDGMSINMGNINTLISLEFKEPAKMVSLIEKAIAKIPEEQQQMVNRLDIKGSKVYMVPVGPLQLYAGFKGNHLVVTMGKPMFEKGLDADPSKGFLNSIKDKTLKDGLKNEISVFYMDLKEVFYTVKNFIPMLMTLSEDASIVMTPEFQKLADLFHYVSFIAKAGKDEMKGDFVIKTGFDKPFFKGVKDVSDKIGEMKQTK